MGSANEKAAGKARISAAQDSGTANKQCVEKMDLIQIELLVPTHIEIIELDQIYFNNN